MVLPGLIEDFGGHRNLEPHLMYEAYFADIGGD
jgi:hypothetical protein